MFWICWHVAPVGQVPPWPPPPPQISAQLVGEDEPWDSRMHCGTAVAPPGAAGQAAVGEHSGEQKSPLRPWILMASSSAWQPGDGFS
eukprot:COSAG06_NODE_5648_length_3342_cov_1.867407_4_plen_87_part_00